MTLKIIVKKIIIFYFKYAEESNECVLQNTTVRENI